MSELLDVNQVARILKIGRSTVYRLVKLHILPRGQKVGGSRRWYLDEIEKAVKTMPK